MTTRDRQSDTRLEPPQALDAEQAVLGSVLKDEQALGVVTALLQDPLEFYSPRHQMIFQAMLNLAADSRPCDLTTVTNELNRLGNLEKIGGRVYLVELVEPIVSIANLPAHTRIVAEKASLRKLIAAANQISQDCYAQTDEPTMILDRAERSIFNVTTRHSQGGFVHIREVIPGVMEDIHAWNSGEIRKKLIRTGFEKVDAIVNGFLPGDLVILGGRPSHGKSQLALQIAIYTAMEKGVLVVSLEMTKAALTKRALVAEAHIDGMAIKRGELNQDDWNRLTHAQNKLANRNLFFYDDTNVSLSELRSVARQMKSRHNLGLVIVDYLQLMQLDGPRDRSREQEVAAISRGLKRLAMEMNVPVLVLSQLSRRIEQGQEREPKIADLRESGALEQDADQILFVHHRQKTKTELISKIIVGKYRDGARDAVRMAFVNGRWEQLDTVAGPPHTAK